VPIVDTSPFGAASIEIEVVARVGSRVQ